MEGRGDTQSSNRYASGCGVCGCGSVHIFRARAGGGHRGCGADDCGDCFGRSGRLFGADARVGYAAGRATGYFGRPGRGELVLHIFCGGWVDFALVADFIFCPRDGDGFSAWARESRGAQRIWEYFDAGDLVGAGAGGFAGKPRGLCDFEVRVFLLSGIAGAGRAVARELVGRERALFAFADWANFGWRCGSVLHRAGCAGGLGGAAVSCGGRAETADAKDRGDWGDTVNAVDVGAETVGAFFDLDGTLLPAPSLEWRFIGYLLERDEISGGHVGRWLAGFAGNFWRDLHGATEGNKRYLCGISEELVNDWERSLGAEYSCGRSLALFDEALQRIVWHRAQGHRLFIVSGTLAPLARALAGRLAALVSADIVACATELEVAPDAVRIWNGRVRGEHMSGGAKLRAVTGIAARYGIDLAKSYAYGDSSGDLKMLEAVGYGVAVNPTRRLARVARQRGLRICAWEKAVNEISPVTARRLASKAVR